jgi:hypothetical protein
LESPEFFPEENWRDFMFPGRFGVLGIRTDLAADPPAAPGGASTSNPAPHAFAAPSTKQGSFALTSGAPSTTPAGAPPVSSTCSLATGAGTPAAAPTAPLSSTQGGQDPHSTSRRHRSVLQHLAAQVVDPLLRQDLLRPHQQLLHHSALLHASNMAYARSRHTLTGLYGMEIWLPHFLNLTMLWRRCRIQIGRLPWMLSMELL